MANNLPWLVFISSPFVGTSSWSLVLPQLPSAKLAQYGGVRAPDWYEGVAARVTAQVDDQPWIAVLHSGAGGFAPALAMASEHLEGFIFVDAVLPYPGKRWADTASADLLDHLRCISTGGDLPPWNAWFPLDPTKTLLSDNTVRHAFVHGLPRVPLAFLGAVSPPGDAWRRLPAAYLQLSAAYAQETAQARALGYAVKTLTLNHLAMLSHPAEVASFISALRERLVDAASSAAAPTPV